MTRALCVGPDAIYCGVRVRLTAYAHQDHLLAWVTGVRAGAAGDADLADLTGLEEIV